MQKMIQLRIVRKSCEPDNDLAYLRGSIQQFGVLQPILLDHDNNLIDGARRVKACEQLGITSIPAVYVKG